MWSAPTSSLGAIRARPGAVASPAPYGVDLPSDTNPTWSRVPRVTRIRVALRHPQARHSRATDKGTRVAMTAARGQHQLSTRSRSNRK